MNDRRVWPLYKRAEKLGIPVLFHTGVVAFNNHDVQFASPVYIDEVAMNFPALNIIIAHMGGQYHNEAVVIAEKNPHVYLDTAYLHFFCRRMLPKITPLDLIRRAVEFAGPTKVLYGWEGTPSSLIIDADLDPKTKKTHPLAERSAPAQPPRTQLDSRQHVIQIPVELFAATCFPRSPRRQPGLWLLQLQRLRDGVGFPGQSAVFKRKSYSRPIASQEAGWHGPAEQDHGR